MKEHYEVLGLQEGASLSDIEKKYKELSKEFDPKNNDNQDFFKEEYDKVQIAYKTILNSFILKNSDKKSENITYVNSESESQDNSSSKKINNPIKQENYILKYSLLFFIAAGVWGMFMQNMGFFVPNDDYTQKVQVVNSVNTRVQGMVNVKGSVDVSNTLDVNLAEINGYSYFYDGGDGKYYLIPTYSPFD